MAEPKDALSRSAPLGADAATDLSATSKSEPPPGAAVTPLGSLSPHAAAASDGTRPPLSPRRRAGGVVQHPLTPRGRSLRGAARQKGPAPSTPPVRGKAARPSFPSPVFALGELPPAQGASAAVEHGAASRWMSDQDLSHLASGAGAFGEWDLEDGSDAGGSGAGGRAGGRGAASGGRARRAGGAASGPSWARPRRGSTSSGGSGGAASDNAAGARRALSPLDVGTHSGSDLMSPVPAEAASAPADAEVSPIYSFRGSTWEHKLHKHQLDKLTVCCLSTQKMRQLLARAASTQPRQVLIAMTLALSSACVDEKWLTMLGEDFWREVFVYLDTRALLTRAALVCSTFNSLLRTGDVFMQASVGGELEGVVTDAQMPSLAHMWQSAETLDLACCSQLTSVSLQHVSTSMRHLHTVNLSFCAGVGDAGVQLLCGHCRGIEKLSLSSCPGITDRALTHVGSLEVLEVLELDNCTQLSDAGIVGLRNSGLRSISLLLLTGLSDLGVKTLVHNCPELEHVRLELVGGLTDLSLQYIGGSCPRLQTLGLERGRVSHIHDLGVRQLARGCPELSYLDLSGCFALTDKGVEAIGRHCPRLESLFLSMCRGVTDSAVRALARGCLRLESLSLAHCTQVSDGGVKALATHCRGLQYLDLMGLSRMTDASLQQLGRHCPDLTELFIRECGQVTDAGIAHVAAGCRLQTLHAGECQRLTDKALRTLGEMCPDLAELHVGGCRRVTGSGVALLAKRCSLRALHVGAGNDISDAALASALEGSDALEELVLCGTNVARDSMAAARRLPHLGVLGIETCPMVALADLDGLVSESPSLYRLVVTDCARLPGAEDLAQRYPRVQVEDGYYDDEKRAWVADAALDEDGTGGGASEDGDLGYDSDGSRAEMSDSGSPSDSDDALRLGRGR